MSAWEVAIKRRLGRLRFDGDVAGLAAAVGFEELPITLAHAAAVAELPEVHRDPFDRLLVAQARLERAVVVTRDEQIGRYDVDILPA